MQPTIEVIDPASFPGAVAEEIALILRDAIESRGSATIAFSGGKTPATVYRLLSRPPYSEEAGWGKTKLFLVDERWVPSEDIQSNARMLRETMRTLLEPQASAEDYISILNREVAASEQGIPSFDLLLLGVGEDGHIASLFPGSDAMSSSAIVVHTERAEELKRVSLGIQTILSARRIMVLLTGEKKADIAKRVLTKDSLSADLPARLLENAHGPVTWFLDSRAASLWERAC
jgi:6-phosphogluconolactonase